VYRVVASEHQAANVVYFKEAVLSVKFRGARRNSKEKSNRGKKAENVGRLAFFSSVSLVRGLCVQLLEISWEDQRDLPPVAISHN
jgi:hypothetical protein